MEGPKVEKLDKILCPNCNKRYNVKENLCEYCGYVDANINQNRIDSDDTEAEKNSDKAHYENKNQNNNIICPKCKSSNRNGYKYCGSCGSTLEKLKIEGDTESFHKDQPEEKTKLYNKINQTEKNVRNIDIRKWMAIGISGVLFLVFLWFGLLLRKGIDSDNKVEIQDQQIANKSKLIPYRRGTKWGFCDESKRIIIQPKYDDVIEFSKYDVAVVIINELKGVINRSGKEIIEIKYTDLQDAGEGMIICGLSIPGVGYYRGLIDTSGKVIIPLGLHNSIEPFSEGLAHIEVDYQYKIRKSGYIDKYGNMIISEKALSIRQITGFHEGLAAVAGLNEGSQGWKQGYINKSGEVVIPYIFEGECGPFSEGLARVEVDDKVGYINKNGEFVIPPIYDYYSSSKSFSFDGGAFKDGIAKVCINNKVGCIDRSGNIIIPIEYGECRYYESDKLVMVKNEGKRGLYNRYGKRLTNINCDNISGEWIDIRSPLQTGRIGENEITVKLLVNDLISVSINGKAGAIDIEGNIIVPFRFDLLAIGKSGRILVNKGFKFNVKVKGEIVKIDSSKGKWGMISKNGDKLIPAIYDHLAEGDNGIICVAKDGKYGFINEKNETIIPFIYEEAREFENGYASICEDGKWGCINEQGKIVIECKYDHSIFFRDGIAQVSLNNKKGYISITGIEYFD